MGAQALPLERQEGQNLQASISRQIIRPRNRYNLHNGRGGMTEPTCLFQRKRVNETIASSRASPTS